MSKNTLQKHHGEEMPPDCNKDPFCHSREDRERWLRQEEEIPGRDGDSWWVFVLFFLLFVFAIEDARLNLRKHEQHEKRIGWMLFPKAFPDLYKGAGCVLASNHESYDVRVDV